VAKVERRDDLDLEAAAADVLDGVGDEATGDILRPARVRGGQDDDFQPVACNRRPKTTGTASTSSTKA